MSEPVIGGCLCGAVRFELQLPTKWVAHCHCSMCQRAHGAGFVTWASVPATQLRIVEGDDHLARYRSSDAAVRSFCKTCGSSLFFESTHWPGEIHVARANIPGELDRAPQAHAFFSDKAAWVTVDDDLPKRGGVTGIEPL